MKMSFRSALGILLVLVAGVAIGRWTLPGSSPMQTGDEVEDRLYTCSMHPQIRQPEPGDCPICGMELILLEESPAEDEYPSVLHLSKRAMALAGVQTSTVAHDAVGYKTLILNGRVRADASRLFAQTAHFPGRIERMDVEVEGQKVVKGQTIAAIYAPQLLTALQELREANRLGQPALLDAARRKLALWKFSEQEINSFLDSDPLVSEVNIDADASGIVLELLVYEGDHVETGTVLYRLANLNRVWVDFDAYEDDLAHIRIGDSVFMEFRAFPGEIFSSKISYIDPVVQASTRTTVVRAELLNPDGVLKPEMLARGKVVSKGKTSTAHAVKVPASAILWTGERSLVYVRVPDAGPDAFQMREVTLGERHGEAYVILDGLESGEEVVTHGTFRVDAAAQLQGKASMMEPEGASLQDRGHAASEHAHGQGPVLPSNNSEAQYEAYLDWVEALAMDNGEDAQAAIAEWAKTVSGGGEELMQFLTPLVGSVDLEIHRSSLQTLSQAVLGRLELESPADTLYQMQCPMARGGDGGIWISRQALVHNPYYGASMLRCGSMDAVIEPK